jgi:PAS domain S-box-containing protein
MQSFGVNFNSEQSRTLYDVFNLIHEAEAEGLSLETIVPKVLRIATDKLAARTASLIVINPEGIVTAAWVIEPSGAARRADRTPIQHIAREGASGVAVRERQPVLIDNTLTDPRWLANPDYATSIEPTSVLCVPLVARVHAIGTLTVSKLGLAQFGDPDISLLAAIAGQAAVAIDNARLYAESQQRLRITSLLNEAGRVVNSSLNLDEILRLLLGKLNEFFNAEAISIALVDSDRNDLVFRVAVGTGSEHIVGLRLPANEGIMGWVMRNDEAVRVNDVYTDKRFHRSADQRSGLRTTAMICAPVTIKGQVLGTMQVLNPESGLFNEDDLQFLQQLASLASSSIANAQEFARAQYAEARYINLFEDSVNPIVLTDLSGIITDLNQRAGSLLGYERDELLLQPVNRLHHLPVDIDETLPPDDKRQRPIAVVENQAITRDGEEIPVEIHMKRTASVDEGVIQWIYYDRSKHVELEQMRQDLTAMLFHDLQNPLSNIISSLELLGMELHDTGFVDEDLTLMLEIASKSSQRLRHLVLSLLDINQLEAGAPLVDLEYVPLEAIAQRVIDTIESSLETRRITIAREFEDNLPPVYANADMIERVIFNLVDNALKFSFAEQTITLSAESHNDDVRFAISDQGPGVPETYRDAIFDKFFRTPNSTAKGIGLGLSFCRLAIERHRGRIWVTEAPGGGARFNFTLPTQPQPVAVEPVPAA